MKLRSPIVAMLWEIWRVTRIEAAWKLAFGVVPALAALILSTVFAPAEWDEDIKGLGVWIARFFLVLPHFVPWLSLASLSGGRPGFPLYLHYSRPVRTAVIVGLPMAYLTATSSAIYLVSAFLLRRTSGYPFPLLPGAAWIAAVTLVFIAIGWSTTRSLVALTLGLLVTVFASGHFIGARLDSFPNDVDYPLIDYAVIALIGLICFGVAVARVARQRRGDAQTAVTRTPGIGLRAWLIDLFPFRCPTSSATWAQIWSELKTNGLPVLTIGVVLAMAILLVSAVGNPIDAAFQDEIRAQLSCKITDCFYARFWPVPLTALSLLIVLFLSRNAFGIRSRQGRRYVSAFEATQACSTAQLAALKVLVRSGCVLAAIIAIGVSVWISISLLGDAIFIQIWNVPLSSRLPAINGAIAALTVYEQLSLVVVATVGVVIWVAVFAALGALRTRHSLIVAPLLFLYGLVLAWLAVGVRVDPKTASQFHLDVVYGAMCWIAAAAMVFTTIYVCWRGFAERVLTIRYASGAGLVSVAFGAAWLTVLHFAGAQFAGMSAVNVISILSPALLPLMASVLAPWSLSRIRHA